MAYASKLKVGNNTYDIYDNLSVHTASSVPANPVTGDTIVWVAADAGSFKQGGIYRFDGTSWIMLLASEQDVFKLKGSVDATEDLPQTGVEVGDVYLVGAAGEDKAEYVAIAVAGDPTPSVTWEMLGTIAEVDLTDYAKTEHINAMMAKFTCVSNDDGDDTFTLEIPTTFTNTEATTTP